MFLPGFCRMRLRGWTKPRGGYFEQGQSRKELSDRVHDCSLCGFSADGDYNAALKKVFFVRVKSEKPAGLRTFPGKGGFTASKAFSFF